MSDFKTNLSENTKIKSKKCVSLSARRSKMFFVIFWGSILRIFQKIWKAISNQSNQKDDYAENIDYSVLGIISPIEKELFKNFVRFRETRIDDIMIPRASIDAVDNNSTIYEVMMLFKKFDRSWMPVYQGSLDNPRGMVHMRDFLAHIASYYDDIKNTNLSVTLAESNLIKETLFVPSSMLASDLLCKIQESRLHIALVIDEHGGTEGLVSYEDIVAFFIGHIKSEHNSRKEMISAVSDHTFIVDARADLEELAKVMGKDCNVFKFGQDVDSLGGLIFSVLDRIPVQGEVIREIPGFEILIIDSDVRCVRRVRIKNILHSNR
ncbi:MAG: magnesium/cobalt efflux protein [Candidatus Liberibacter europaeus]|uniref:Magnesium/cobalt efflux protein n=1 Tax=Candidatus Liberibacter europaeus TaxID=744859 RepID=A0A2T4VYS1_9HYPH|nr:magnesium/cobalt efflux protein [Candidatus Liberibacter europaeus]PTL86930.1 MAG: magnesium/cobalt efflux protein [Candidatus Liberibacter europaeus]